MKYGLVIGETLSDRLKTSRATWKQLDLDSDEELLGALLQAMGEPTSDLSQRSVALFGMDIPIAKSSYLNKFWTTFDPHRFQSPFVRSFEGKGFQVDWALRSEERFVFIEAKHIRDPSLPGLAERLKQTQISKHVFRVDAGIDSLDALMAGILGVSRMPGFSDVGASCNPAPAETQAISIPGETIRIGLVPYLRSMWTLLWTALRHPFTTTVIDLSTGKRIAELSVPFQQWEQRLRDAHAEPVNG